MALVRWQATVQDDFGNIVVNPVITVRVASSGALATIYDDAGVAKSNPFIGTTEGFASFKALPGSYRIEGVKSGIEAEDWVEELSYSMSVNVYKDRDEAVAASLLSGWAVGSVISDGRSQYRYVGYGSGIPDMLGWVPDGVTTPEHFASNITARSGTDGSFAGGSNVFTAASASFSAVDVGKLLVVANGLGIGATKSAVVTSVVSETDVTLDDANGVTQTGASWVIGVDASPAWQAAADYVASLGGGRIQGHGAYMFARPVWLGNNTEILGPSKIIHPLGHGFKGANASTTGTHSIRISGLEFSANDSADGAVSIDGIDGLSVEGCRFSQVRYYASDGTVAVTVGVGVGQVSGGAISKNIRVTGCHFDVPDYGVVIESGAGNPVIRDVVVSGCTFWIGWGSGVSISRNVRSVRVYGNSFHVGNVRGDDAGGPRGLGVKVWQGTSLGFSPADVVIESNTFDGVTGAVDAISVADYTHNIAVNSNTYRDCRSAVKAEYGRGARGLSIVGGSAYNCKYIVYAADGASYRGTCSGMNVYQCGSLAYGQLTYWAFSDCYGEGFTDDVFGLVSQNSYLRISGITVDGYAKSFVSIISGTAVNITISDNILRNGGTLVDATYDVMKLNNQAHSIIGNTITNEATNKPRYIIGGTGDHRVVSGNWLFGAKTGYFETDASANDVFTGNKLRGGIG